MKNQPEQFKLQLTEKPKPDPRKGWTSASNAEPDSLCPGRHIAQRGLPELPKDDDYAEHGKAIHDALAARDPSKLTEAARQTYDLCLEVEERVVAEFFGDEAKDLMTVAEERFWVIIKPEMHEHSGQVDRVYRSRTKALVIDYKTLPGDVPMASSNLQLRDEVVLVKGELLVKTIGCVLIQPLVTMTPEICVYDEKQLRTALEQMFDRVRTSNKSSALVAGAVQCKFCRAKFRCEKHAAWQAQMQPELPDFISSPVVNWDVEQCLVFLERVASAELWLDQTKKQVRQRVEKGEIPGWKIGPGDRKFEVTNVAALSGRLLELGVTSADFLSICKPNKEKMQALVRAATKTKGKGLMAEMDKVLLGLTTDERKTGSLERIET